MESCRGRSVYRKQKRKAMKFTVIDEILEKYLLALDTMEIWLKLKLGLVLGFILAKIIKLYAYAIVVGGFGYLFCQVALLILEPFAT
jgi:hypothetical protein